MGVLEYVAALSPLGQVLLGTGFTYGVTMLGAAMVFFVRNLSRKLLDSMLGFAAGVMLAATFWSLLAPAIEMSAGLPGPVWLPAAGGFLAGTLVLRAIDALVPHLHFFARNELKEGISTSWKSSILLVLAITMHNIPEGLAVGVAFGAAAQHGDVASLAGALSLALGIGIQNFPEGAAVSIPLRREGFSRTRSFFWGQLSGAVEPLAGIAGVLAVTHIAAILPWALSFAAGAMFYVVVEEVIPEAQKAGNNDFATMGAVVGFLTMMILDVGLG